MTVTTPKENSSALSQRLRDANIRTINMRLQGRFHDLEYASEVQTLVDFCNIHPEFCLPDVSELVSTTRHEPRGCIKEGSLHQIALYAILVEHCNWEQTFASAYSGIPRGTGSIITFGLEPCVPPSYQRRVAPLLLQMSDIDSGKARFKLPSRSSSTSPSPTITTANKNHVAVVGMSCRVPGAPTLPSFWTLLQTTTSQHAEIPPSRIPLTTPFRPVSDPKRKWFANLLSDPDPHVFDHKFFGKSAREATFMDPQQKMMLQAAYQAVEQAGYFASGSDPRGAGGKIGCWVGVSNVDYQDNVACHAANAYTATGNLMSFVAGKISHYFGWTGPSLSIDTACSGSAVAVHSACRALINGEVDGALAGGVNAITSPLWFQNLAGASFLSPTGQCKPFDAAGDGYCRGEAVGAVFLKRLDDAVRDGDQIFGTIAATEVLQNQNCTAITVPNAPSLSNLFRNVTSKAGVSPHDISVVEAHGTGTAVGDPAEYDGIRTVLGGPKRYSLLALRSIKGLVGHAECASGMVALIKTLLSIHNGAIPPQASHSTLNPALHATPSDKIEISMTLKPWNAEFKAALINNYGASGSNASMVVTEAPKIRRGNASLLAYGPDCYQPFWFCGADDRSLQAYIHEFLDFLRSEVDSTKDVSLANLSFNLARQSNRWLKRALILRANTTQDLQNKVQAFLRGEQSSINVAPPSPPRPVILCFGGQVSTHVGLDRQVFERVAVLRKHLDECNAVCKSLGLKGIYPDIFQKSPIEDTVQLQIALFAMQYSCAQSWIDCGVHVSALVGHSFGELVAQTVAGVFTLADGLRVISRRACLIRDSWSEDRGAMMAVEAELKIVETVLARANGKDTSGYPSGVACSNGPRSFTIAGSSSSIRNVEEVLKKDKQAFGSVRYKKLNTSHAFHSTLVEPLLSELEHITHDISFSSPRIPVERARMAESTSPLASTYIAEHLRQPVYFGHAVERLARKYHGAIWLEAGSQSTVTAMVAKALGVPKTSHFQAMHLTSDDSWARLTDATVALWKEGLRLSFWSHHPVQTAEYTPLLLPPYQFEQANHSVELKTLQRPLHEVVLYSKPQGLWTFIKFQDAGKNCARFRVETGHATFLELMAGHTVAHAEPLCPSTLQLDIATEAIRSLCPEFPLSDFQLELRDLENQSPICRDPSRVVWLDVEATHQSRNSWSWKMVSNPVDSDAGSSAHASGKVFFRSRDDSEFLSEFGRFERLITHSHCRAVLEGNDAEDILQGKAIYKLFADVVDYSEVFRGVRKVVGRINESAGRVVKKYSGETWLDTPLCDSFCQVAGVFVNCMTERSHSDAFISNGVERIVRSPFIHDFEENPEVFDVLALHHRPSDRSFSSDVFIFDSHNSQLLGVILGIKYQRVSKLAMARLLARLTPGAEQPRESVTAANATAESEMPMIEAPKVQKEERAETQSTPSDIRQKVAAVLSEMVEVDAAKLTDKTNLPDLGIDSLMGMEIARELESVFKFSLDISSMMSLVVFSDLVQWVRSALSEGTDGADAGSIESGQQSDSESSQYSTPGSPSSAADGDAFSESPPMSELSRAPSPKPSELGIRQKAVDALVARYSDGFSFPAPVHSTGKSLGQCVLITGATGSLGAHLVEHFAKLASTTAVICFNRPSRMDPMVRQLQSLADRGLTLEQDESAKLQVIESDTWRPLLGLDAACYANVVERVTHIIHNAWPMTITRPISGFEKQFTAMRNLIDLARDASPKMLAGSKIGFQFVSSIATVGLYPVVTGNTKVPEAPTEVDFALPSGYSDSKVACEKLLSQTLNQYPDRVNAMAVRVGQVAGSRINGYWNPAEHMALVIKSAQTLRVLPDLPGTLSWLPVNDVAAVLAEVLLAPSSSAVCHIENPTRQPWSEVIALLAAELDIPAHGVIPYEEWLECVRSCPRSHDAGNPARNVMEFLEKEFLRMACGGLVLDIGKAVSCSDTLRAAGPVQEKMVRGYVRAWKKSGFL
ncbi:ketoacyl-synt-domain-containing protein [Corynespora cassiicola Philippines]|uniref:Ketoacyl-synt-domain-containing protein n=1 Tax=Corynespora cassiicola Philippines TaxID=1448308 RepID=A0A2T2NM13_CORCC|nr:ketoacyl-synt-domain-containing protein [Corynespora cassiicola Philippines]